MKEALQTEKQGDYVLELWYDENPLDPRDWIESLGKMICFHKNYNLGDKHDYCSNDYEGWDELREAIVRSEKDDVAIILPLYLYDHSGITMSTSPFSCGWDSGQVGFIFTTEGSIKKRYGVDTVSDELLEQAKGGLIDEVKEYDAYLRGEVYAFSVKKVSICNLGHEHSEIIDSCGNFYDIDQCTEEGRNCLKDHAEKLEQVS